MGPSYMAVFITYYPGQDTYFEFPFHLLQTKGSNSAYLVVLFQISRRKLHVKNFMHNKQSIRISYYNIIIVFPELREDFFFFPSSSR